MSLPSNSAFRAKAFLCGYVLVFGGVVAAYFTFTRASERMAIARNYKHAEGVVVGQEVQERMERSARMMVRREYYYPVVEYLTEDGVHTITGEVCAEEPLYKAGRRVPILYPPDHPDRGLIANFSEMYFVATIRGGLALFLFLAAAVAFVVPKMMDDPYASPPPGADPAFVFRGPAH
jgi:hypothetical protein